MFTSAVVRSLTMTDGAVIMDNRRRTCIKVLCERPNKSARGSSRNGEFLATYLCLISSSMECSVTQCRYSYRKGYVSANETGKWLRKVRIWNAAIYFNDMYILCYANFVIFHMISGFAWQVLLKRWSCGCVYATV